MIDEQRKIHVTSAVILVILGFSLGALLTYLFLGLSSVNKGKSQPANGQSATQPQPMSPADQKAMLAMQKVYSLDGTIEKIDGKVIQIKSFPDEGIVYAASLDANTKIFSRELGKPSSDDQAVAGPLFKDTEAKFEDLVPGDKVTVQSNEDIGGKNSFSIKNIYKIVNANL